jgi:hypothetical protein
MITTPVPDGMRVDVYWNIAKRCFSVRSRERDTRGLVIAHVNSMSLIDVSFIVSESGRQRVLRQKRKNVHAYLRGTWSNSPAMTGLPCSYNPYRNSTFMADGSPIHNAQQVSGTVVMGDAGALPVVLATQ